MHSLNGESREVAGTVRSLDHQNMEETAENLKLYNGGRNEKYCPDCPVPLDQSFMIIGRVFLGSASVSQLFRLAIIMTLIGIMENTSVYLV
jgi:hypothetical protein